MLFGGFNAVAQITNSVYARADRMVIRTRTAAESDVLGSPYLVDDWAKGNVKFKDNSFARNGDLRYDVLEDVLVVKGTDGNENVFDAPVDEFTLNILGKERLFKTGFTGDKGITEKTYFEVIYNGKHKFLKRTTKTLIESRAYNSASVTKKLEDAIIYYIAGPDNKVRVVKRNEKAILDVLKNPQLNKYVKENKLNLKEDVDIIKLFTYYDTL